MANRAGMYCVYCLRFRTCADMRIYFCGHYTCDTCYQEFSSVNHRRARSICGYNCPPPEWWDNYPEGLPMMAGVPGTVRPPRRSGPLFNHHNNINTRLPLCPEPIRMRQCDIGIIEALEIEQAAPGNTQPRADPVTPAANIFGHQL